MEVGHVEKLKTIRSAKAKAETARKTTKTAREKAEEKAFKTLNFEDIITFSDYKIKKMIKNLEIETVSAAMKGANKELREKVEKNLGKRALKTYHELLKQIKTMSESEIKKSRKLIEKQIKLLTK